MDYTKVSIVIRLIFLTWAPDNCDVAYWNIVGRRRDGEVTVRQFQEEEVWLEVEKKSLLRFV